MLDVVPQTISADTVHALEVLLAKAKVGDVIGVAFIALGPAGAYEVDVAGVANNMPVFVRGLLPVLDDQLGKLIGSR